MLIHLFLLFLLSVSPLPAMPLIIILYKNYPPLLAFIGIYISGLCASLVHYYIGYLFGSRFSVYGPFRSRYIRRVARVLFSCSLEAHTAVRISALIPAKLYRLSCGYAKVKLRIFILSGLLPFIFYQSLYIFGVNFSDILFSSLPFSFHPTWLGDIIAFVVTIVFAFLLTYLAKQLVSRFPPLG